MLEIQLIRHGRTAGNIQKRYIGTTDEHLLPEETERLKQLRQEGRYFVHPDAVISSPLLRCRETADILFPTSDILLVSELAECDFGEFENKNYLELSGNAHYQEWIDSNGTLPFPGGESREDFSRRCMDGLRKTVYLSFQNHWHRVAMTVHGGTIMALMSGWGLPKKSYYDWHTDNGFGVQFHLEEQTFLHGTAKLYFDKKI